MSTKVGFNGNIKTLQKDSINRNNTFSKTEESQTLFEIIIKQ